MQATDTLMQGNNIANLAPVIPVMLVLDCFNGGKFGKSHGFKSVSDGVRAISNLAQVSEKMYTDDNTEWTTETV